MKTDKIREALTHLRDNEAFGIGADTIRAMANAGLEEADVVDEARTRAEDTSWLAKTAVQLGMGRVTVEQLASFARILLSGR